MLLLWCVKLCGRFWRLAGAALSPACCRFQRCCHRGVAAGRPVCVHTPWHDVGGVAAGAADVCGGCWRIREESAAEAQKRQQGVLSAFLAVCARMKKSISNFVAAVGSGGLPLWSISLCRRRRVVHKTPSLFQIHENIAICKPTFIPNKGVSTLAQTCSNDCAGRTKSLLSPAMCENGLGRW